VSTAYLRPNSATSMSLMAAYNVPASRVRSALGVNNDPMLGGARTSLPKYLELLPSEANLDGYEVPFSRVSSHQLAQKGP
jgi:hypothetical protein